jgi:hypothetical protein
MAADESKFGLSIPNDLPALDDLGQVPLLSTAIGSGCVFGVAAA